MQFYDKIMIITYLQEGIKPFREHVAIVLHESVLNEIKGAPEYYIPEEESNSQESNSDVMIVDNPKQLDLTATEKDICRSPLLIMPMDPRELIHGLRKKIMSIQDAESLE